MPYFHDPRTDYVVVKICGRPLPRWCYTVAVDSGAAKVSITWLGSFVARAIALRCGHFARSYPVTIGWKIAGGEFII